MCSRAGQQEFARKDWKGHLWLHRHHSFQLSWKWFGTDREEELVTNSTGVKTHMKDAAQQMAYKNVIVCYGSRPGHSRCRFLRSL